MTTCARCGVERDRMGSDGTCLVTDDGCDVRAELRDLRVEVLRVAEAMDESARATGQYPATRWTAQLRKAVGDV